MTIEDADRRALELLVAIEPFCAPGKAVIAGSIRRRVPNPSDVELVCQPITADFEMLNGLRTVINGNRFGTVDIGPFPSRYTRIKGPFCNYDIFWQSRETFGLNLFIRTGSAQFVADALAYWKKITNGGYSEGAILHQADGTQVPTHTEEAVFEALQCKWVEPEKRNRVDRI